MSGLITLYAPLLQYFEKNSLQNLEQICTVFPIKSNMQIKIQNGSVHILTNHFNYYAIFGGKDYLLSSYECTNLTVKLWSYLFIVWIMDGESPSTIHTMEQVRSKLRNEVFTSIGTQHVFLSFRNGLVMKVISQYMDPSILNFNLHVGFDGEDGADFL